MPALTPPPLITDRMALLLDLDGTLIDFAPTPDAVVVPPGLPPALATLRHRLDGALAIITGRPVDQIDRLLPGIPHAVAGEHGAAIRHAPAAPIERGNHPPIPAAWLAQAEAALAAHPGALLERKPHGVALHFRRAPASGPFLHTLAEALVAELPSHALLAGSMVWEVRPRGIDKGHALRTLMAHPPFLGRTPLFIGDDVTDEDAIQAARALGGIGLRVDQVFGSPQGVRDWLAAEATRS
jgi:trehalose 6-phosphate phosphatase